MPKHSGFYFTFSSEFRKTGRVARVADRGGLENRYTSNGIQGSNP